MAAGWFATIPATSPSMRAMGGAEVHAKKSGVSHFTYDTEGECLMGVRKLLTYLPSSFDERTPVILSLQGKQALIPH